MPAERTIMRQVREVLRLKFVGGVPIREIARRIRVAASTVRATIRRFQAAGLNWPLSEGNDRCRARGQVVCRCRHEAGLLLSESLNTAVACKVFCAWRIS